MIALTRRGVIGGGCACLIPGAARADHVPLIAAGYRPVDADERGLWHDLDRLETEIAASNLLVGSPALQRYGEGVLDRLLGPRARETRLYLLHDADFNAAMAPNGMMLVNTGLLVRCRDEAQFASVLGHEAAHYLRRHSLAGWRDRRRTRGAIALVGAGAGVAAGVVAGLGGAPRNWIALANAINTALVLAMMRFSRAQETEADGYGLQLIAAAGYPPGAAADIWSQTIEERRASARARGARYRDPSRSALSTHPPTVQRLADLRAAGDALSANGPGDARAAAWRAAIAPVRVALLAEQVALNDSGTSLYLIGAFARDGWDGVLRYYEGEAYRLRDGPGDAARATTAYAQAVAAADAPAAAWRAHGYALLKAGRGDDGRAALRRYLACDPHATDAAMIAASLGEGSS